MGRPVAILFLWRGACRRRVMEGRPPGVSPNGIHLASFCHSLKDSQMGQDIVTAFRGCVVQDVEVALAGLCQRLMGFRDCRL